MPFSMGADLVELDLLKYKNTSDDAETKIHKAFLNKILALHPDRGGSRADFQRAVNAFQRLKRRLEEERQSDTQITKSVNYYGCNEREEEYWYKQHLCFFERAWEYDFASVQEYQVYFENWHREQSTARLKLLKEEKVAAAARFDDSGAQSDVMCMFCGCEPAITKVDAERDGIDWDEYCAHPDKLTTCKSCKESHVSVLSEKMALLKFSKNLSTKTVSNTGFEYYPFFAFLQSKGNFFHQTIQNKVVTFYWFPDLEMEALSLGWRPRGKRQQEAAPWVRKDLSSREASTTTPNKSSPGRPRKRNKPMQTDDISIDSTVSPDSKRKRRGKREKDMHYPDKDNEGDE